MRVSSKAIVDDAYVEYFFMNCSHFWRDRKLPFHPNSTWWQKGLGCIYNYCVYWFPSSSPRNTCAVLDGVALSAPSFPFFPPTSWVVEYFTPLCFIVTNSNARMFRCQTVLGALEHFFFPLHFERNKKCFCQVRKILTTIFIELI